MSPSQSQPNLTAVPVNLLRHGVYVVELDRPWTETPFLFQGFSIESEEELETLRSYCRFIYADLKRSQRSAVEQMRVDAERLRTKKQRPQQKPAQKQQKTPTPTSRNDSWLLKPVRRPSSEAVRKSLGVLTEPVAHPDHDRFRTLVKQAHALRHDTGTMMRDTLYEVERSGTIDAAQARAAAEEITAAILEDATASLWLTHLRDKDEYLATHSVNVCILSLSVGTHMGLDEGRLKQLGLGALLHAVGRVQIPRKILEKAGPLTVPERDLVQGYPETGLRMVADSGGIPNLAREVIRLHHERWSGSGYPEGRFGDEIPQLALITGIADAYDAMTSDRPYRAAMAPDEALHVLYENADKEFSQTVVQAFMRVVGAFPIGTLVELDNSAVGMVVGLKPGAGLWPTVLMLRTPEGEPYEKRLLLNLAATEKAGEEHRGRRIRRARRASDVDIDPGRIVSEEFGLSI